MPCSRRRSIRQKWTKQGRLALAKYLALIRDALKTAPATEKFQGKTADPGAHIAYAFDEFDRHFGPSLGNYFSTIYESLLFIRDRATDKHEFSYARLFRSQLSGVEVVFLAYYCIAGGYSANPYASEPFKLLVERYSMLSNLPQWAHSEISDLNFFRESAFKDDDSYI